MMAMKRGVGFGAVVMAALTLAGCGSVGSPARAKFLPTEPGPSRGSWRSAETVEVLLDRKPARPFVVVGHLVSKTSSNPTSIEAMKNKAAQRGLDGIYWIDCIEFSGRCRAKGYVYADRPNMASR